jgi:hypothetical protein
MKFSLPTLLNGQVVRLLIVALCAQGAAQAQNTFPATGNVGVGTTAPTYPLTLAGAGPVLGTDNTGLFAARNTAGTYEGFLWPRWSDNAMYMNYGTGGFYIRNNASAVAMYMTNAGNVGIGTTAPTYRLTLAGGVNGILAMDNAASIMARNSAGAYEAFLWPRFSDNITYMNYGSAGLRIRTNAAVNVIEANSAGRVGIGTAPTANATLTVKGSILTEQVRVRLQANWPDYVFTPAYRLAPLAEVEQYIRDNGHLPTVPSAAQVEKEGGVELGAMNAKLLEIVEELTLYLIEEKKAREKEVAALKAELNQLKGAGNRK